MALRRSLRSDPYLKTLYNDLNRRFYGNHLPADTIVRWATKGEMLQAVGGRSKKPCLGMFAYEEIKGTYRPVIRLYSLLRKLKWGGVAKATLLHEVCHLEGDGRDSHGPAFDRRMLRLAQLGAFAKVW